MKTRYTLFTVCITVACLWACGGLDGTASEDDGAFGETGFETMEQALLDEASGSYVEGELCGESNADEETIDGEGGCGPLETCAGGLPQGGVWAGSCQGVGVNRAAAQRACKNNWAEDRLRENPCSPWVCQGGQTSCSPILSTTDPNFKWNCIPVAGRVAWVCNGFTEFVSYGIHCKCLTAAEAALRRLPPGYHR